MVKVKDYDITKNELDRIGNRIRNNEILSDDIEKISDYRSEHLHLIRTFVWSIRSNKIIKQKPGTIISQRLKRMPSIISKLKRFEKMKLSNIQDFAGVRVIFDKLDDVYKLSNHLKTKTYKNVGKNNFLFVNEKNYIQAVKDDGYRSIHQIYKYQGKNFIHLKGYKIELQIRTKLQHQWATAVEILDLIEKTSLKIGNSKKEYKDFFLLASKLIEQIELNKYSEAEFVEIVNELKEIDLKYNILAKLSSLNVVKEKLEVNSGFIIMILDINERKLGYKLISDTEDEAAVKMIYSYYENKFNDKNYDVVMVSMKELKDLKKAYPNYSLDAKQFINTMNKYINPQKNSEKT